VSNIWIRSRNTLSRSLAAEEREAVFGDFAELGLTDRQAAKSVLGLVMRRQLRLWKGWGPWLALAAIILPVCPLLATSSSELGVGIWPSVWMKLHHGVYYETGLSPAVLMAGFCLQATALITWSWTSGFALGTLSRRTIWVSGTLFFALDAAFSSTGRLFSVGFSRLTWWAWLPLLTNVLFVVLPAYFGVRQSTKSLNRRFPWIVALAVWTVTMGGFALWTQGWPQAAAANWSRGGPALTLSQLAQYAGWWELGVTPMLTTAVLTGPIFYLLAKGPVSYRLEADK
jgi:hypothetical protein